MLMKAIAPLYQSVSALMEELAWALENNMSGKNFNLDKFYTKPNQSEITIANEEFAV